MMHDLFSIIIYMKEILDSDWLRAVQFKINTRAKLNIIILDHDSLLEKRKFCLNKPMTKRKMATKILFGNFEKSFLK